MYVYDCSIVSDPLVAALLFIYGHWQIKDKVQSKYLGLHRGANPLYTLLHYAARLMYLLVGGAFR